MLSGNAANVCLLGVGIQSHDLHLAPNNWGFAKLVKAQDFDSCMHVFESHIPCQINMWEWQRWSMQRSVKPPRKVIGSSPISHTKLSVWGWLGNGTPLSRERIRDRNPSDAPSLGELV